jgi:hypothetical protein
MSRAPPKHARWVSKTCKMGETVSTWWSNEVCDAKLHYIKLSKLFKELLPNDEALLTTIKVSFSNNLVS